jgi:hypothetical protein
MKTAISNYSKMVLVLVTVMSFGLVSPLFANTGKEIPAAELKFVGTLGELPSFQLALNNALKGEYQVIVKDGDKRILFSEKLKGENITRVYKLDEKERDIIDGTTFEVTNLTTNETKVFRLNKVVREVVDVTISNK